MGNPKPGYIWEPTFPSKSRIPINRVARILFGTLYVESTSSSSKVRTITDGRGCTRGERTRRAHTGRCRMRDALRHRLPRAAPPRAPSRAAAAGSRSAAARPCARGSRRSRRCDGRATRVAGGRPPCT
eukprot:1812111-Prymnesium_polylepis.2